ncbi:hypothetical protein BDB01DRAFT_785916 [Pilobolus umbonatus]|nr:hypothetical protein BDB01DRAFT_785916 [Pilobolus umbonatus]
MPTAIKNTRAEMSVSRKLTVDLDSYPLNVRPVVRAAINEATHTLVDAFNSNSTFQWMARRLDPEKRDEYLDCLFKNAINTASGHSRDFVLQIEGCKGVIIWSNKGQTFSWSDTIQSFNLARLIKKIFPLKAFNKLHVSAGDKLRRITMKDYPKHICITFIGVLPQEQRKGLGSALLESVLDKADQCNYPVYVEAIDYQSVKFFEKSGFVSQGQMSLNKNQVVFVTPMVRLPIHDGEPLPLHVRPGRVHTNNS